MVLSSLITSNDCRLEKLGTTVSQTREQTKPFNERNRMSCVRFANSDKHPCTTESSFGGGSDALALVRVSRNTEYRQKEAMEKTKLGA